MGKPAEDAMVAKAFDADKHDELARAIEKLTPDEAAYFLTKLEAAVRKRKIQLTGYLVAMLVWLVATIGALVYYGTYDGFTAWVFLIPFGLVGVILFAFGRWSEKIGAAAAASAGPSPAKPDKSK